MDISNVAELTVDELKDLIRETVTQTIMELFSDPDARLELREEFKFELQHAFEALQENGKTSSAQEVANELGLEW
jgi:hypothetical protein